MGNGSSNRQNTMMYNMRKYSSAYAIGDLHGDARVLIITLLHAQVISAPPSIIHQLETCSFRADDETLKQILWTGKNSLVFLLGDLVDTRRERSGGVCSNGQPIRQDSVFKTIVHLQDISRKHKGKVVAITGNHCLANMLSMDGYCAYAPDGACTKDDRFHPIFVEQMRMRYQGMHAENMLVHLEMVNHVNLLLMHGGFNNLTALASFLGLQDGATSENLKKINSISRAVVRGAPMDDIHLYKKIEYLMPSQGRPHSIHSFDFKKMQSLFDASGLVKAHDVQNRVRCERDTEKNKSRPRMMCFTDVGMSRAFGIRPTRTFGYLWISKSSVTGKNFTFELKNNQVIFHDKP